MKNAIRDTAPEEAGYWLFRPMSYLGLKQDWDLYIVDTKTNTARIPGMPETTAKLSSFLGQWKRPELE